MGRSRQSSSKGGGGGSPTGLAEWGQNLGPAIQEAARRRAPAGPTNQPMPPGTTPAAPQYPPAIAPQPGGPISYTPPAPRVGPVGALPPGLGPEFNPPAERVQLQNQLDQAYNQYIQPPVQPPHSIEQGLVQEPYLPAPAAPPLNSTQVAAQQQAWLDEYKNGTMPASEYLEKVAALQGSFTGGPPQPQTPWMPPIIDGPPMPPIVDPYRPTPGGFLPGENPGREPEPWWNRGTGRSRARRRYGGVPPWVRAGGYRGSPLGGGLGGYGRRLRRPRNMRRRMGLR
jgi:hypothetical protein